MIPKTESLPYIISLGSLPLSWHLKWSHLKLSPESSVHHPTFPSSLNVTSFHHIPCQMLKGHHWHLVPASPALLTVCLGSVLSSLLWSICHVSPDDETVSLSPHFCCIDSSSLPNIFPTQKPDWPYKNINGSLDIKFAEKKKKRSQTLNIILRVSCH